MQKRIFILLMSLNITMIASDNLFLISIPKAGNFLIDKVVNLITNRKNIYTDLVNNGILKFYTCTELLDNKTPPPNAIQITNPSDEIFDICTSLKSDEFIFGHLCYERRYERIFAKKNFKLIFIIRDPRDQLMSRVFYTQKLSEDVYPGLAHLSTNELIESFMGIGSNKSTQFNTLMIDFMGYSKIPSSHPISNIKKFYQLFLPWMQNKSCLTVRFENLVGPQGGGSEELQIQEILSIAKHLSIEMSVDEAKTVASKIFGQTMTFREGKIGTWKKYFTSEHKEEFKKIAGQMLIDLGYEKDLNW